MAWDVLSGVTKTAWDVMSGVTKTAWDVLSGVTKTTWDVLSGVANLCGMFCPGCQKMAWDVLSRDVLSYIQSDAGIATMSYVTLYIITSRLSMQCWSKGRQFRSFSMAVTLEVYL